MIPSTRYFDKLACRITNVSSRLCVGIDPRPESSNLALEDFLKQLIEETSPFAAAFKPNMAYFEALGKQGLHLLEMVLDSIDPSIPIILDAKRGDIGETQFYYAKAYFEHWNVDAVTLNPFLGYDSIEPFLNWQSKAVYLLAVTSNPGSADIQRQLLANGKEVFECVTSMVTRSQSTHCKTDVGCVVGLTNANPQLLARFSTIPLLVPGLGAQGGQVDVLSSRKQLPDVVNVSRGISYAEDGLSFAQRAQQWARLLPASH